MDEITRAKIALSNADALLIYAGAGMGVDSGLPDFRGEDGFWKAYPMLKNKQLNFRDLASPKMFETNPDLAWGFYGQRLNLYRNTIPHEGFELLKSFADKLAFGYFIFTSNVDGQFQSAGFNTNRIYECHGSIHWMQTLSGETLLTSEGYEINVNSETLLADDLPTDFNNNLLRPNILMFGDDYWNSSRAMEQKHKYREWLRMLPNNCKLVLIEVGAGNSIPTVRREAVFTQDSMAATLIRINPEPSIGNEIHIQQRALEALTKLLP